MSLALAGVYKDKKTGLTYIQLNPLNKYKLGTLCKMALKAEQEFMDRQREEKENPLICVKCQRACPSQRFHYQLSWCEDCFKG